jgi:hypothetical protein
MRWQPVAAAALTIACATGCAAPRAGFAPSRDACVSALPLAFDTVHDKGRLIIVHQLGRTRRHFLIPVTASACVFVFRGPYQPGSVVGSKAGGRYAHLVITTRHPKVLIVRLGSNP